MTEDPSPAGVGFAPIDVWLGAVFTARLVVPVDPRKFASPEYTPEIVSVPTGAAEELQVPEPFDSVAVHRVVPPVVKATVPVGVGTAVAPVVTVAE